jgi:uridine phosphorylase
MSQHVRVEESSNGKYEEWRNWMKENQMQYEMESSVRVGKNNRRTWRIGINIKFDGK